MKCRNCGNPVNPARWELGYEYCQSTNCVAAGLRERGAAYRQMLVPKQGYTVVKVGDPALMYGRSSGRQ